MCLQILKFFVISLLMSLKADAFWWQPTTTETPVASVKHIPLTYFRTYTYQPLTGGPFTFPFNFGAVPPQTPLLNGARYEHFTYPAAQHFNPAIQFAQQPPSTSTTIAPTTTPTTTTTSTTTTTTTTTPPPTTTKSTTTTTTPTTSLPSSITSTREKIEPIINSGGGTFGPVTSYASAMYPNYNRRVAFSNLNNGNFYRPHYPYPDYASITKTATMYQSQNQAQQQQQQQQQRRPNHVQFVPCMCPVSVGVPSGLPIVGPQGNAINIGEPSHNLYLPQSRSNDVDDVDNSEMDLSAEAEVLKDNAEDDTTILSDDANKVDGDYRESKELKTLSTLS